MRRREFVSATGAAGVLGLAGCIGTAEDGDGNGNGDLSGDGGGTDAGTPTRTDAATGGSLPDGVYVQSFRETMSMQGMAAVGDYKVGLMYVAPHVFWTVTGHDRSKVPIERSDSLHMMALVWNPETRTVLPETGVSLEILQGEELISQEVIYPMLSQSMGFHYGGNFGVPTDGEYTAKVHIGGMTIRRTGAFAGQFDEAATAEIGFVFNQEQREKVEVRELEAYGKRGAVKPIDMGMPLGFAPKKGDLPGRVLGTTTSDDGVFVSTVLEGEDAARFDAETYLAVSARTPYNRYVLPAMALSATLTRDGETVFEGPLTRTLDPNLDYHYGAAIDGGVETGDRLTLTVDLPPQVARHEGYERAFLQMGSMQLTV